MRALARRGVYTPERGKVNPAPVTRQEPTSGKQGGTLGTLHAFPPRIPPAFLLAVHGGEHDAATQLARAGRRARPEQANRAILGAVPA